MDFARVEECDGAGRGCWIASEGRESLCKPRLVSMQWSNGGIGNSEP